MATLRDIVKRLLPRRSSVERRGIGIENTSGMMSLFNLSDGNVTVNDTTIAGIPALVRAIEIVANGVAKLPVQVYSKREGTIRVFDDHPVAYICNAEPNEEQTPFVFWWSMIANAFLSGGGGAEIVRDEAGRPVSLRLMRYGCQAYKVQTADPLRYWDIETGRMFFPEDVLYIPGIWVRNGSEVKPLSYHFRNTFGEPLAQTLMANTLFKQGVYPSAVYSYTGMKGSAKGDEAMSRDISRYFGGLERAGMVLPIPNMDKFQQLKPVSPADFQMMEARKWTIAEISRITGVPPEMLAESDKQSYGYSEQSAKSFISNTLDPWLTKRDQELRKKLFTEAEKRTLTVESKVDETMWMLPKDRVEYWYKLFQMGAITANEIRAYLNMNAVEGGEQSLVQVNLAPLDAIGTLHNANEQGQP